MKKQILFREGDPADCVYLLASGAVCLYRFLPNGRRLISRFLMAGDVVGLSFDDECPFTAECIGSTTAFRMSRSELRVLCAHSPSLQKDVMLLLSQQIKAEREDHYTMMHQVAHARVARLLRIMARRHGADLKRGEPISLSMNRRDIADYLGLTIETVCRSMAKLKSDGLISASSPDRIRIEDAGQLGELAGDE